ncbi:MAG: serine/threonine protein kinase, partial [Deltaproteobacteria bacterium]|nr:serine/threonine protein kinase [Deltaproteobacteria bacterium]
MAEVFLAQQEGMAGVRRLAVVKKILPQFSDVPTVSEMLLDEARIAIQLSHPNIVQIYELGQDEGQYFIAMEYVNGCDLATLARIERHRKGRVPMRLALRVVSEAAMGLDYAHRQKDLEGRPLNIIHRDVSPHNIMCSREGAVKVTDFGIAKAVGKVQVTEVGVVKGKVQYMAPEQYTGAELTHRADIFSLGVVLYQLTTGKLPRASKSGSLSMRRVIEGRIPLPSSLRPDYPEVLEQIVMRALAHNPTDRYPDAASLRDDLLDFARQRDLLAFPKELGDYLNENVPDAPTPSDDDLAGKILHPRGGGGPSRDEKRELDTVQFGTERVSQKRSVIAADQQSDPYGHTEMKRALQAKRDQELVAGAEVQSLASEACVLPNEQLTPFPEDKARAVRALSKGRAGSGEGVDFSGVSVDLSAASETPEPGDDDPTLRQGDEHQGDEHQGDEHQ